MEHRNLNSNEQTCLHEETCSGTCHGSCSGTCHESCGKTHDDGCSGSCDGTCHAHENESACSCSCACSMESDAQPDPQANRRELLLIGLGAVPFILSFFFTGVVQCVLLLLSYVVLGGIVLWNACKEIFSGHWFGESFLMAVATIGALCIGEATEAVAVMLFYRVGEFFQQYAVAKSRRSIESIVGLRPDQACVLVDDKPVIMNPDDVPIGSVLLVKPGERIALDGEVIQGESYIDNAALTGESVPVRTCVGSAVLAGGINQSGVLYVRTTCTASESSTSRILRSVKEGTRSKPRLERFITRFSRIYTPVVVGLAALVALLPPLLGLGAFEEWIHRALLFLVISCPCALVLSVPLTFFAGLARCAANGVLLKGANYLEVLSRTQAAVLDKTGTLTKGVFEVQQVHAADGIDEQSMLDYVAAVESMSTHPIAKALCARQKTALAASEVKEIAGHGMYGVVQGHEILVGNSRLLQREGVSLSSLADTEQGAIYIAMDGRLCGWVVIADEVKEDANDTINQLNTLTGYTAILTGDSAPAAERIAQQLGVKACFADLLPEDKLSCMQRIRSEQGGVLFVGDGINDAPVLAGADIGMAIGLSGTDTAVETADAVLLTERLTAIPESIRTARAAMRTAKRNIAFAIGVKVIVMLLGVFGLATTWMGVFADVGVALLCVLHAMTLLPKRKREALQRTGRYPA